VGSELGKTAKQNVGENGVKKTAKADTWYDGIFVCYNYLFIFVLVSYIFLPQLNMQKNEIDATFKETLEGRCM